MEFYFSFLHVLVRIFSNTFSKYQKLTIIALLTKFVYLISKFKPIKLYRRHYGLLLNKLKWIQPQNK